jgi:hypothetical protein
VTRLLLGWAIVIRLTEVRFNAKHDPAYQCGGDAAMSAKTEVEANEQSDAMKSAAPVELALEQLEGVAGGCFYGNGIWGPTLILPVLVAVLIG